MTELNELVVVAPANVPALFAKDGCDPLLKRIKEEVGKFEADISTAKGRKEIASMASKVAKSKVYLEGLGKDLVTGIKEQAKVIDAERKKVRDELDILKEEVRKPLTDWEDAEKKRVADIEARIAFIGESVDCEFAGSYDADIALKRIKAIVIDDSFEEFELAATKAKEAALTQLEAKFIVLQNAEKEKAEADRLEKERLEKEQKEREEKIAEQAREDEREKARLDAFEKEREEKEEREKLEKEKLQLQLDKEKAERETKEAEDKAEQEKKEAAEKAERDKEAAIEEERKRVAAVEESERQAEEKLAKNKAHRGKLNKEAKKSFIDEGFEDEEAERIIKVIAKGRIANITINY